MGDLAMKTCKYVLFVFLSVFFLTEAKAQEETSGKSWEWYIAPINFWGTDIVGDMVLGTETVPINVDFGALVNNLNAAYSAYFEGVHKSNWGFIAEYNYLKLDNTKSNDLLIRDVGITTNITEIDGLYRFRKGKSIFDVLFGIRYTHFKYDVNLEIEVNGDSTRLKSEEQWVDPIIGGRWKYTFSDKFYLYVKGDIGGFGTSSKFTWQANALVNYQPFRNVGFFLGYRALGQNYETGRGASLFKLETTYHGPLVGVTISW